MERNYFYRRWSMSLLFLITLTLGTSCTIYQNVPDDDGIYTTENTRREPVVVVEDSDEHREYKKNYFTEELEKIDRINGTDIITDIETYSSYNDTIPDKSMDSINEPTGRAWGYNDGDNVVININLNNNWDYGWGWGGFYDPFFNPYPWFAGPRWGWGWGWNRPFWNPYWGFNRPFWGGGFYAYNGFRIGNYSYGRRTAYNSAFNTRSSSLTRRGYFVASRRANVSQLRNRNTSARRQSSSTNVSRRNSSSTVRRNSQTARNRSTSSRRVNNSSSSVRRNNSRSYNRPSPSRGRSYNRGSSSGASRSSGGVSRGSSSRGGRRGG